MRIPSLFRLTYLGAGLVFLAGNAACTDLEPEVYGAATDDTPVSTDLPVLADPEGTLKSTYDGLNDLTDQGGVFALMEHTSDELIGPTRGTDWSDLGVWRQLHAHTWTANHTQIRTAFINLSNRSFAATRIIATPGISASTNAQAKFLRAFYMGHSVDFFGQVPFREANQGIGTFPKVLNRSEATDLVLQDLRDAIGVLPEFNRDGGGVQRTGAGAISKQAAQTFLMRMLLNKAVFKAPNPAGPYTFEGADMDEVISLANSVIATPLLQLQAPGTYFKQFAPNNTADGTEAIFALQFQNGDGIGASAENRYRMTLHYNTEVDGWNGFTTIADFLNKWDKNDERYSADPLADDTGLRAGFLEGQQYAINNGERIAIKDRAGNPLVFTPDVDLFYATESQGVRVIKYYPDVDNVGDPANDYVFLRLADVYLMKAEAQLRKGDNAGALATVNQLRASRQGAAPLASLSEQTLLDERGFELYWEGIRRTDQIRFGQFTRSYNEKEYESDPRVFLFPIPQEQLATNPDNLVQNPGY